MSDVDPADPTADLELADAVDDTIVTTGATSNGEPAGEHVEASDAESAEGDDGAVGSLDDPSAGEGDDDAPGRAAGADVDPGAGVEAGARGRDDDPLATLAQTPLDDHPAVYERIHHDLQAALAGIDGA